MKPSKDLRAGIYARDGNMCIRCGTSYGLSFQHRRATGMGGSKIPLTFADGITACLPCNQRFESDLQQEALAYGWKVPRWVNDASKVPVCYLHGGKRKQWARLVVKGASLKLVHSDLVVKDFMEVFGASLLPNVS